MKKAEVSVAKTLGEDQPIRNLGVDDTGELSLQGRPLVRKERSGKAFDPSIDEEQVSLLVETFYDRIRQHPRLSVLFAKGLTQNWATHLETMKSFWRSMLMQTSEYGGRPVPAHMQLDGVTPDDFTQWLALFRSTAEEVCPASAAKLYIDRAETIAKNLQMAMFMKGQIAPQDAFCNGVLTEEWAEKLKNCAKLTPHDTN
ncbi:group III truncated hemoglobin [uncultured Cohaesibacter sp.]|uniref:group III truncated hemoglobin n=1 Tax=uncultured Cohaesibacter sp. TaxID=1002546 RepID=UPI0029C613AE|nr:group III truncated hemoglobin [uncultured Cohaesibacter sp.]